LTFDQPEYWDVLKFANDEVVSLNKLQRKINEKYSDIDHSRLIEIIEELESSYLLYSSTDHSKMVSIIDTERF
jgi:ATP-dependent protease HslVU (ClpYQ) ATPase subunit